MINQEFHKKRLIRLRYLQSLMQLKGDIELSPELLNLDPAKSTQYADKRAIIYDGAKGFNHSADVLQAAAGADLEALKQVTSGVVGDVRKAGDLTTINTLADSGWVVGAQWAELVYSRARMPIGIREIAIGDISYSPISTIVSKTFYAASPISKITLMADEFVPPEYPAGEWIRYEITFDDISFYKIVPENKIGVVDGSRTILVNSKSTSADEHVQELVFDRTPVSLRVKISLFQPGGADFVKTTPVLKSYRLKVTST